MKLNLLFPSDYGSGKESKEWVKKKLKLDEFDDAPVEVVSNELQIVAGVIHYYTKGKTHAHCSHAITLQSFRFGKLVRARNSFICGYKVKEGMEWFENGWRGDRYHECKKCQSILENIENEATLVVVLPNRDVHYKDRAWGIQVHYGLCGKAPS